MGACVCACVHMCAFARCVCVYVCVRVVCGFPSRALLACLASALPSSSPSFPLLPHLLWAQPFPLPLSSPRTLSAPPTTHLDDLRIRLLAGIHSHIRLLVQNVVKAAGGGRGGRWGARR